MKTLGQINYESWSEVTLSQIGRRFFAWEDISSDGKEAWEAGAQAVKSECDKQLEAYRKVNQPVTGEPNDTP